MNKVKNIRFLLFAFTLFFLFAGCATTQNAKEGKGAKTSWTYKASIEETWDAIDEALESIKQSCTAGRRFEITEKNKEDRYFVAESRLGMTIVPGVAIPLQPPGYPGHNIYILLTPVDDKITKVEVTANKKTFVSPNTDWGTRIRDETKLTPAILQNN